MPCYTFSYGRRHWFWQRLALPVSRERLRWRSSKFQATSWGSLFTVSYRISRVLSQFFVPYLMALFLIGLPLLILEISLGQYYQTGDIGVFGSFNRRLRGIGLTSVVCSFIVVTYYSMLIAWVINAFFDSFGPNDPWATDGTTGEEAVGYFYSTVIGMDTLGDDLRPTRIVGKNVGYSFLTWLLIWLCLAFGTKWTGRITYFTMGLPIVLLFVFLGKAVSLPGASDGINAYIGTSITHYLLHRCVSVLADSVSRLL